ncbi:MAG: hypothetical protein J6C38_05135 [Oscillospiraceae bacterium]|nr:hypothetical protein [Oscillospiraceae bacterium]
MRELSSQINKSLKVASSTVRFGGRTVKVCGNTIKKTIHAPAEAKKNIKLLKVKFRSLQKATAKGKLKKAVGVVGKTAVKGGKAAVKGVKSGAIGGARFAANSADRLVDSIDNDTVRFAKQSADAARAAAEAAKKAGKVAASGAKFTGRTIKTSVKVARSLATKKGRRALNKSIHRSVERINRNIRRVKATPKRVKKAAKRTANAVKKLIQLGARFIGFLISTMPWSLIILGFSVIVILFVYLVSNSFSAALGAQERVAGWALNSDDEPEQIYTNIAELAVRMETACENSFSNALKQEITNFCSEAATPPNIIAYKIGESSGTIYPAGGADGQINAKIDSLVTSSTAYSSKYYSDFMAALVVLMTRAHGTEEGFALEKFTVADMENFLGGLNSNSCEYGSTFFVKTTSITDGETCPGAACKKKKKPGCDCGGKDDNGRKICKGHPYCDNDHKKMTVTLQTVAEYTGKSIPEVYGFNESDTQYFNDVSSFISDLLNDMSRGGTSS